MMTVYLPKVATLETGDLVDLITAQNDEHHIRLQRVFKSKVESKSKFVKI